MPNTGMSYNEALAWAVTCLSNMLSNKLLRLSAGEAYAAARAMTTLTNKRWVVERHSRDNRYWQVVQRDLDPINISGSNRQRGGTI